MTTATDERPIHAELRDLNACEDAREWARGKTPEAIWSECERGDWMLWWAGRTINCEPWTEGRRPLVIAAVECARLSLTIYEKRYPGDNRVRACLDIFERWGRGEAIPLADLKAARGACYAAYAAAYADAAAAYAAAYAAAAYAADAAAAYAAAAYAADAADAAAYAAARARALKECADIVRRHFPTMPRAPK